MPAASAALASVDAATSSSGSASSSRTRRTVASSAWRRSSRPAARRPRISTSRRERRLDGRAGAAPGRSALSTASSSARCSITSSACDAIALTAVPPSMLPMLVLVSRRGGRLSARAMRQTSSIALGRPRLAQEWPPGPRTAMRARRLPDRVDRDVQQAVTLERQHLLGPQILAGSRARPTRLPRPSSPTVKAIARPARSRSRASCSTTWTAQTTAAALSPTPGPTSLPPARRGSCGSLRAKTVSTCASTSTRGRPSPKRQIRLPVASTARRPGASARRRSSQARRSPSSNVGAGMRASARRSSRASSTALTPRGRYQAAMRPG